MNQKAQAFSDDKLRSLRYMMWMLLGLGLLLRLLKVQSIGFTIDELQVMYHLKEMGWWNYISQSLSEADNHPPLTATILALWMYVVPPIEVLVRLPFVVLSACSVFFAYKVFGNWFSRRTALLICAFIACGNLPVLFGVYARPYGLALTLLLFCLYQWDRTFNRSKPVPLSRGVGLGLSTLALFYTHYPSYFIALSLCLFSLACLKRNNLRVFFLAMGLATLGTLPYLHLSLQHAKNMHIGPNGWGIPPHHWEDYFWVLAEVINRSWWIAGALLAMFVIGVFSRAKRSKKKTKHLRFSSKKLALLSATLVGHSVLLYWFAEWILGRPVGHQSMLLPIFPFALAAFIPLGNKWFRKLKPIYFLFFSFVLAYSTLFQNAIFKTTPFVDVRPVERFLGTLHAQTPVVLVQFPEAVVTHLLNKTPNTWAQLTNPSDCRALDSLRKQHWPEFSNDSVAFVQYIPSAKAYEAFCTLPFQSFTPLDSSKSLNLAWNFFTLHQSEQAPSAAFFIDTAFAEQRNFEWILNQGTCQGEDDMGTSYLHVQVRLNANLPIRSYFSLDAASPSGNMVRLINARKFTLPKDRMISCTINSESLHCTSQQPLIANLAFGPLQDSLQFQVQGKWVRLKELYNKP